MRKAAHFINRFRVEHKTARAWLSHLKQPKCDEEQGFALAEVLVALSILSLICGYLLSIVSDGTARRRDARALSAATEAAQSLLAQVGRELPLLTGERYGTTEHHQPWRMRIERFGDLTDRMEWPVAGYRVAVEVRWKAAPHSRFVTLTALRLAAKDVSP